MKDIDCDKLLLMGEGLEKQKNAVFFTMHFCNWLYHCMYTSEKLGLNLEIKEINGLNGH